MFDSTVKFDRCGVCGGNGSTCKIEFEYAGVPDAYGKNDISQEKKNLMVLR